METEEHHKPMSNPVHPITRLPSPSGPLWLWLPWLLAISLLAGCGREEVRKIPPETVWDFIERETRKHHLDPGFIFAIAMAESSLNAHAVSSNGSARGIMQMSEDAWTDVTRRSWRHAYNWKTNIRMAIRFMLVNRDRLVAEGKFNYPRLAGAYRFGYGTLRQANFDVTRLPPSTNLIYREIFSGNIRPVPTP